MRRYEDRPVQVDPVPAILGYITTLVRWILYYIVAMFAIFIMFAQPLSIPFFAVALIAGLVLWHQRHQYDRQATLAERDREKMAEYREWRKTMRYHNDV